MTVIERQVKQLEDFIERCKQMLDIIENGDAYIDSEYPTLAKDWTVGMAKDLHFKIKDAEVEIAELKIDMKR